MRSLRLPLVRDSLKPLSGILELSLEDLIKYQKESGFQTSMVKAREVGERNLDT